MGDYSIYALKAGNDDFPPSELYESLKNGEGRFGWSYIETANLEELKVRVDRGEWDSLTDDEKGCYVPLLLEIKEGDYVIYINMPEWGHCTLAKVTGKYRWRWEDDDFNHRFAVDPSSVRSFDRNDAIVHPHLRARLRLMGKYWRIYAKPEFEDLLKKLQSGDGVKKSYSVESDLSFLGDEISPLLQEISRSIQKVFPSKGLEALLFEVFRKVPNVLDIKWQRYDDRGADLVVVFEEGVPFSNLSSQRKCLVQAKSYVETHWDTQAVKDIERAFAEYPDADMGLIVSTADESSEQLDKALEELRSKAGKPVGLMIGKDVARFVLKYGMDLFT